MRERLVKGGGGGGENVHLVRDRSSIGAGNLVIFLTKRMATQRELLIIN